MFHVVRCFACLLNELALNAAGQLPALQPAVEVGAEAGGEAEGGAAEPMQVDERLFQVLTANSFKYNDTDDTTIVVEPAPVPTARFFAPFLQLRKASSQKPFCVVEDFVFIDSSGVVLEDGHKSDAIPLSLRNKYKQTMQQMCNVQAGPAMVASTF